MLKARIELGARTRRRGRRKRKKKQSNTKNNEFQV